MTRPKKLRLERLENKLLLAGDTYLVNFQLDSALTPNRYLPDGGELYGDRGNGFNYGWSSDHTDVSRDRDTAPDQRLDTLLHFKIGQDWEFSLPNGTYEVTASIGDAGFGSTHTLNVEGTNYWTNEALNPSEFLLKTEVVTIADGRLTLDQGAGPDKGTRINYLQIVGLPEVGNLSPLLPTITEPVIVGEIVNPTDVHMEAIGFNDPDGDLHLSTDWEIWSIDAPIPIYSDLADGFVEFRTDGGSWPQVHPSFDGSGGEGFFGNVGEWFTNGITSTVLPFQLPNLGAVNNPFSTANLGVHLFEVGNATTTSADLYAIRVDSSPSLLASDYYSGSTLDASATLLQEDFLTPSSTVSIPAEPNNFTSAAGDAALVSYLNTAYNGGLNAGNYVFLRLSYASDSMPTGWDAYKITTSNAGGGIGDFPVLSYTTNTNERVWQTLGITGVERLHTHLGDGVFEGSHGGRTELLPNTNYQLRARFRDDAGSVSDFVTRDFTTDVASAIFPLDIEDIASTPIPTWQDGEGDSIILFEPSPVTSQLRVEAAAGDLLLAITSNDGTSNTLTNPAALPSHANIRIVIEAGTNGLTLEETDLNFVDGTGLVHNVLLPTINLLQGQRLDLWVALDGSTYFGNSLQTAPNFDNLARGSESSIPFIATEAGFSISTVAGGLQLPVNIAFVPNPGSDPGDPLFYVNELYGTIKVVTNDYTVSDYATGLLNFNPTGAFPGSGEQGLAGLAVDPVTGDLIISRVTDTDGLPNGEHHPQVVRLTSLDGGLTASSETVILDMVGESQGQSHQVSNVSIGPDGLVYVHNGDGFDASTALNLDSYRGKILRMNLDGSAPTDNPLYDAGNGINSRDYIYAYGFRNPFGGAWRDADQSLYEVENGNSLDRLARVEAGGNYDWNGGDNSLLADAKYIWNPAHAPVNLDFIQPSNFAGSQFPASKQGYAFVSESGPTYASGPQARGKRIVGFEFDTNGDVLSGPITLVEYAGSGRATVVAIAAGPDGIYFSELYKDEDAVTPIDAGARIFKVSFTTSLEGDYDIDGDVDQDDYVVWRDSYGSKTLLAADGNNDGTIDAADYTVWRDASEAFVVSTSSTIAGSAPVTIEEHHVEEKQSAIEVLSPVEVDSEGIKAEPISSDIVSDFYFSLSSRNQLFESNSATTKSTQDESTDYSVQVSEELLLIRDFPTSDHAAALDVEEAVDEAVISEFEEDRDAAESELGFGF